MQSKITSKNSVDNGDQASVTSDATTPLQAVSPNASEPCLSLQVTNEGIFLADHAEPTAPSNSLPLSPEEEQDLERCEKVLMRTKKGVEEAWAALDEIWSKRLYRSQYGSFKEYCKEKWKFSRAQGYRLLKAHETMKTVSPTGDTSNLTINERQLRELAKAPKEKQTDVFKKAQRKSGSGKMTNRQVKEAAAEVCEKSDEQVDAAPRQADSAAVKNVVAVTNEFSGSGFPTFKEMYQMAENIASLAEEPDDTAALKTEIAKLRSFLRLYSQFEGQREAA